MSPKVHSMKRWKTYTQNKNKKKKRKKEKKKRNAKKLARLKTQKDGLGKS